MKIKNVLMIILCLAGMNPGVAAGAPCCSPTGSAELRTIRDDLGGEGLAAAFGASLRFFERQPSFRKYLFCDQEYSAAELAAGLRDFLGLYEKTRGLGEFDRRLREEFMLCAAGGADGAGRVLVTGYFEPLLEGSLRREPPFIHPLYQVPPDLVSNGGRIGRLGEGGLLPYWSRAQIENDGLLAGGELVFVDDPVEAFILHVQGSGRVRLRDGTVRRIQFAAKNGLPYRSIGRLLVDQGKMSLEKVSLPAISGYLADHPEERRQILHYNESFIFFRWGDEGGGGPLGRLGEPLTAGRSVALDHDIYPPGVVGFLQTRKPVFNAEDEIVGWAPLGRFVVNQDSGSAIAGPGRLDLFLGGGRRARAMAGVMKHPGMFYLVLKKK